MSQPTEDRDVNVPDLGHRLGHGLLGPQPVRDRTGRQHHRRVQDVGGTAAQIGEATDSSEAYNEPRRVGMPSRAVLRRSAINVSSPLLLSMREHRLLEYSMSVR